MKKYKTKWLQAIQREGIECGKKLGYAEGYMQSEKDRIKDLNKRIKQMPYRYFKEARSMEDRIWSDEINPYTEESKRLETVLLQKGGTHASR